LPVLCVPVACGLTEFVRLPVPGLCPHVDLLDRSEHARLHLVELRCCHDGARWPARLHVMRDECRGVCLAWPVARHDGDLRLALVVDDGLLAPHIRDRVEQIYLEFVQLPRLQVLVEAHFLECVLAR
jgi:hypothetical protein